MAEQQPDWADGELVRRNRKELAGLPALVDPAEIRALGTALVEVAQGRALVVQAGDCAEDPADCAPAPIARKLGLLDTLAGILRMTTGLPVLKVGRIAGQFAKPRSRPTELVDGKEVPAFRGHLVNSPQDRRPDPDRLLHCYHAAARAMSLLSREPVWTSHEALLLDYEQPQLRDGWLTSTHWPWIGDRTRHPDGSHVRMLAGVGNPVACKVGPDITAGELAALCQRLDPDRRPGRLTLIARLGAANIHRLSDLARTVEAQGHPAIWLCDPMHGNTIVVDGVKTRNLATMTDELTAFHARVTAAGGTAGGLHIEATPDAVTECLGCGVDPDDLTLNYTSLCDPRLNREQAMTLASHWPVTAAAPRPVPALASPTR